ncbi:ATP-dependent RNA helicase DDX24-like isoform X2 [Oscarella lobularis]|uniref:ATP-dependent RNA helicase DDX24-like isoform X2 n=1 Tax=Oscarella lobularis TaxID=121494 RepID=UPI003314383B
MMMLSGNVTLWLFAMISAKGKWKEVAISGGQFKEADFEGLVDIKELSDYEIVNSTPEKKKKEKSVEERKRKGKKRARKSKSDEIVPREEPKSDVKNPKKRKTNMEAWSELDLPDVIIQGLEDSQFASPTPIQAKAIPPAVRDRRDVVGAAETGSGKTLAFGIPLLYHILRMKETAKDVRPLYALVLAPTRELALQVKKHLVAVAKYTSIQIVAVVGGMAAQKQERFLQREPEIVVGTPGRLWEMIDMGDPHLSKVADLPFLVIDEADRMVEQGHFAELANILDRLPQPNRGKSERQTFVFSATLTLPKRMKKKASKSSAQTLDELMKKVRLSSNPCVIDLTQKRGTVETLVETRITCTEEEKDVYLYYFLLNHPGRTLVFTNTIDCIRRLKSLLALLKLDPLPLHAGMQQRQRLKNLDRFSSRSNGLLLASDVAARGLDIPNVDHVIHYQIPKNADLYVHRSGRTARASADGISVMLVGPKDLQFYRGICKVLNRDRDLSTFPVDMSYWLALKERISLAKKIDKEELSESRVRSKDSWFLKTAKEMDIDLDDEIMESMEDRHEKLSKKQKVQLKQMKAQLVELLERDLLPFGHSVHFPTSSAKLIDIGLRGHEAIYRSAMKSVTSKKRK